MRTRQRPQQGQEGQRGQDGHQDGTASGQQGGPRSQTQRGQSYPESEGERQEENVNASERGEKDVLNQGRSANVRDIRTTLTVKHNQIFLLCSHTGDIKRNQQGLGVYFRDTEYLDEIILKLNGVECMSVMADDSQGDQAYFQLTNLEMKVNDGEDLNKEKISVKRVYTLEGELKQHLSLRNMSKQALRFDLSLMFGSHFEDMMVIRGSQQGKRGTIRLPRVENGKLILRYEGADEHTRTVTISFDPPPERIEETTATWPIALDVKQETALTTTIELADEGPPSPWERREGERHIALPSATARHEQFCEELSQRPTIRTSNPLFDRALNRSFEDIRMLATADHGDVYIAGGIPWYVTLFGRDSCTCAFEVAPFLPRLSKTTMEVLARYQGREANAFRDEEPGKILHELRLGQKANLEEIPQVPYYGTVDATPLFLIVLAEYIRWTGDTPLFERMQPNIRAALEWIDANPTWHDHERGGFLRYGTRSERGLKNHGWKDAGNAIINERGEDCAPPIALVEVQGYAYRAEREMGDIYQLCGEERPARVLHEQAERRRAHFNKDFWLEDEEFYAFCLERNDRPVRVVASNPGQALFTGIVDPEKAPKVRDRLLREDMFAGWGVRTLSSKEVGYNPLDYEVGSLWPHDNALIGLGMWEYGFHEAQERIFTGMFEAAQDFEHYRLPECFCGFGRDEFAFPVKYPVACSPQAWSAGALPLMLRTALGLKGRAFEGRLLIRHPHLPPWLTEVSVEGLCIGQAKVNLEYRRVKDDTTVVVTGREGKVEVDVEY